MPQTCILARNNRALTEPAVMFKIQEVSAVSRFFTSRRKSTSLYCMGRDKIALRSESPNLFFSSAFQAISRQAAKS